MRILQPVKGEEWIEKMRQREFWIGMRRSYPQALYSRLTKSYVGWWMYMRVREIWSRGALLIDPSLCGGFLSHLRCFWYNWMVLDIVGGFRCRVWKLFHKNEWEKQCAFFEACMQASVEGCADPIPAPDGFPAQRFHGSMLGERYFKRVAEIMRTKECD